jgi:very-short-patch-repair endonuclease
MAKNNFRYDDVLTSELKQTIINDYVNNYLTIKDIKNKYNINSKSYIQNLLKGHIRSASEAGVIAHKNKPEAFKHSNETKNKIRECRLKFMKEHPEQTAWRKRNLPSYPEQCFINFLQKFSYDKHYYIEREYPVFPFYIDFAFVDVKLAIEIDGSQHILDKDRVDRDKEKDISLINKGWKVLRISENAVKTDWDTIKDNMDLYLNNNIPQCVKVGIFKTPKIYDKKVRNENGLTKKQEEQHFKQRKVSERPSKESLLEDIHNLSFVKVGKKYGVSDNTIRKWCKIYELPYRKKDMK